VFTMPHPSVPSVVSPPQHEEVRASSAPSTVRDSWCRGHRPVCVSLPLDGSVGLGWRFFAEERTPRVRSSHRDTAASMVCGSRSPRPTARPTDDIGTPPVRAVFVSRGSLPRNARAGPGGSSTGGIGKGSRGAIVVELPRGSRSSLRCPRPASSVCAETLDSDAMATPGAWVRRHLKIGVTLSMVDQ